MPFDVGPQKKHTRKSVLLIRAAEIIADPRNWNIGKLSVHRLWRPSRYCAIGAVNRAIKLYDLVDDKGDVMRFLNKAAQTHGFTDIAALNDHPATTHDLVQLVFAEAVELAMAE